MCVRRDSQALDTLTHTSENMMKITVNKYPVWSKAEISQDQVLVRLTLSESGGEQHDEIYYIKWIGAGMLNITTDYALATIGNAEF